MESSEGQPPQTGGENRGIDEDVEGRPAERRDHRRGAPDIGDDAEHGQTAVPAAEDDVGVPPDDEMNRPGG